MWSMPQRDGLPIEAGTVARLQFSKVVYVVLNNYLSVIIKTRCTGREETCHLLVFALMRTRMHTHDFPGVSISKKSSNGPIVAWFEDHVILAKN